MTVYNSMPAMEKDWNVAFTAILLYFTVYSVFKDALISFAIAFTFFSFLGAFLGAIVATGVIIYLIKKVND